MDPIQSEDLRRSKVAEIATELYGLTILDTSAVRYDTPRIIDGINLVVDCDLAHLAKQVEFDLNSLSAQEVGSASYKVSLNTLNGICQFTAQRTRN